MERKLMRKQLKSRGVIWHIYHTILAIELGIIVIIESIELMRGI
jgi:hypothetical protein